MGNGEKGGTGRDSKRERRSGGGRSCVMVVNEVGMDEDPPNWPYQVIGSDP